MASLSLPLANATSSSRLDLGSSKANILLGADLLHSGQTVTIDIAGRQKVFFQGSLVTAAEYVAIRQVLAAGQTLQLTSQGTADGGTFSLSRQLLPHLSELVVPAGVTAIDYVSDSKNLAINGDLINYGSIYAYAGSTSSHLSAVTFSAKEIINERGGIISSLSPAGLAAASSSMSKGKSQAPVDLGLHSIDSLINDGSISSSGNLTIAAATVSSDGGTISAANGQISVMAKGAINMVGDNISAASVQFKSPSGAVNVLANSISGKVSVNAVTSNMQVAVGDLVLQSVKVKDDPIFVNATGSIILPATIVTQGGPVTAIAAQNILGAGPAGTTIDTSNTGFNPAGAVTLLAGTASSKTGGTTTATGASPLSGDISGITSINAKAAGGGAGGDVTVAAFGGSINIGAIETSTRTGPAGHVSLFAPQGIRVGEITTHGSHAGGTYIDIETADPSLGSGLKYDSSGNLLQGSIVAGPAGGGSILTGNLDAGNLSNDAYRGGDINVVAGGSVTTGSVRSLGGGSSGGAPAALGYNYGFNGGAGGNVNIAANGGSAVINGDINTAGGGGGGSNIGVGGNGGDGGRISIVATGNITVNGPVVSAGGGGGGGSGISSEDTAGGGGSLGNGGGPDSGGLFYSPPPYEGPGYYSFGLVVGNPNSVPFPYPGQGGSNTAYDIGCCGGGYGGSVGNPGNTGSTGTFQRGWWDDISPHAGGAPGLGGNINITGAAVSVSQTIGTYYGAQNRASSSPYASYSVFAHSTAGGGQINITATGSQVSSTIYATDGDLTTTAQDATIGINPNAVTIVGKTLGNSVIFNGTVMSSALFGGSYTGTGTGQIQISENGSGKVLTNGEMITPAELVAAIQISSLGGQSLVLGASGQAVAGNLAIASQNLPASGFTNLVIPTNVSADLATPSITVGGSTAISGSVRLQNSTQLTTGSLQLSSNVYITASGPDINFAVTTPLVNLGAGSLISTSGNISIIAPTAGGATSGLQLTLPDGGKATISSTTGHIVIDGNGQGLSTINPTSVGTATLALLGGPVSLSGASVNIGKATVVSVNNPLTITTSAGQITNDGTILAVSPGGAGGTVTIQSTTVLNLVLGNIDLSPNAIAGGNGGNLNILSPQGQLTLSSGLVNLNATGQASFDGGHLVLTADGLALSNGSLAVSANAVGGGIGGQVSITNLAGQDMTVAAGAISISASGGSSGSLTGDGGAVTLSSGGNLYVDMTAINVAPLGAEGNGAKYGFTAGTYLSGGAGSGTGSGNGIVSVTGNIDASGRGSGSGGSVTVVCASNSALTIGAATGNGVAGYIHASGGTVLPVGAPEYGGAGGSIVVQNLGTGGLTIVNSSDISAQASAAGGHGGSIALTTAGGPLTLACGVYDYSGSGTSGAGGSINIKAQSLASTGTGQVVLVASGSGSANGGTVSIDMLNDPATLVFANATSAGAANGSLVVLAVSGGQGGNGGQVSVANSGGVLIDAAAIGFNAAGPVGNGGSIAITAATIGNVNSGPLLLDASAPGTGNGGQISITLTVQNTLTLSSSGDMQLRACGGSNAGNGGTVLVNIAGQLSLAADGSGLTVAPLSGNGNGGNVAFTSAQLLVAPGAVSASGPFVLDVSGQGVGNGGSIAVSMSNGGSQTIGSSSGEIKLIAQSGLFGGNGGSVTFIDKSGSLSVDTSGLLVNPLGKNGSGGALDLEADSITWPAYATAPLVLNAGGKGLGNGGAITINQMAGALNIGKGPGQLTLLAAAGKGGGNGGSVIVKSAADLSVAPAYVSVSASGRTGAGGTIDLEAGGAGSGNILITGALSAAASGTGPGGQIWLSANSATPFNIGGPAKSIVNGVTGLLSAGGAKAGTISVTNLGGGINVNESLSRFSSLVLTGGGLGSVLLSSSLGSTLAHSITINQNGSGNVLSRSASAIATASTVNIATDNATGIGTVGGIMAGMHGGPATNSGAFFINAANLNLPSAAGVYIKDSSRQLVLQQQGATTGSFKLVGGGQITVSGDLNVANYCTLVAGSIVTGAATDVIKANDISLSAGRLGIGTTAQPLLFVADTLQVGGAGPNYLQSSSAAALNLGPSNFGRALSLATLGDINVTGTVGSSSASIKLSSAAGNIDSGVFGLLKASTINLTATAESIGITGGAGGAGPLLSQAKSLTIAAQGSVNINNVAPTTNWQSIKGASLTLLSSSAANIASLASTAGDIRVTAGSGHLATLKGAQIVATGGSIYLNGNATRGTIAIGPGSLLQTESVAAQQGSISVTLGRGTGLPFTSKLPSALHLVASGSGSILLGTKGVNAIGAITNVSANDQSIVFDTNTRAASTIQIGGGSSITAGIMDVNLQTVGVDLLHSRSTELTDMRSGTLLPLLTEAGDKGESMFGEIAAELLSDQDLGIADSQSIISRLDLALPWTPGGPKADAETLSVSAPVTPGVLTSLPDALVGGISYRSAGRMRKAGNADTAAKSNRLLTVDKGNFLFVPAAPLVVATPHGQVSIAAGAIVLLMVNGDRLGLFDFDDQHAQSVVFRSDGQSISLHPGRHLLVAAPEYQKHEHKTFEQLNVAPLLGFRNIYHEESDSQIFVGEFDLVQGLSMVRPLKTMVAARAINARKQSMHLLKTATILLQLHGAAGDFRPRPQVTLVLNRAARL